MLKGIQHPVGYEGEGIVMLVQAVLPASIGNHPLHHIVSRHDIAEVVLVGFEKREIGVRVRAGKELNKRFLA